jgi:hypothetical protein
MHVPEQQPDLKPAGSAPVPSKVHGASTGLHAATQVPILVPPFGVVQLLEQQSRSLLQDPPAGVHAHVPLTQVEK